MALPLGPPRFVRDEPALAGVLLDLKLTRCPHCRRTGALIGHGLLRGYAELGTRCTEPIFMAAGPAFVVA